MNLTIELLAELLNTPSSKTTLWTKGDLKRIYLNEEGYNTRKTSTSAYVYQRSNETFGVFCKVECVANNVNWSKSQEKQVIERINYKIEKIKMVCDFKLKSYHYENDELILFIDNFDGTEFRVTESDFFFEFGINPRKIFKDL